MSIQITRLDHQFASAQFPYLQDCCIILSEIQQLHQENVVQWYGVTSYDAGTDGSLQGRRKDVEANVVTTKPLQRGRAWPTAVFEKNSYPTLLFFFKGNSSR